MRETEVWEEEREGGGDGGRDMAEIIGLRDELSKGCVYMWGVGVYVRVRACISE